MLQDKNHALCMKGILWCMYTDLKAACVPLPLWALGAKVREDAF